MSFIRGYCLLGCDHILLEPCWLGVLTARTLSGVNSFWKYVPVGGVLLANLDRLIRQYLPSMVLVANRAEEHVLHSDDRRLVYLVDGDLLLEHLAFSLRPYFIFH